MKKEKKEIKSTIAFKSELIQSGSSNNDGSLTIVLPNNVSKKLLPSSTTMIEGTINAFPFRTKLELKGKILCLTFNKALCSSAGIKVKDLAKLEITRVGEEPEVRIPLDLKNALSSVPNAKESWEDITPMARRDWVLSITTAKQPETRAGRIEKACSMLSSGKRRICCFPGINWIMKDHPPSERWMPLPK